MKPFEFMRVGKHAVQNVLLALSFGYCSLSLLALLDRLADRQRARTKRVGLRLYIVHVLGADAHENMASATAKLAQLQATFPQHEFSSVSLEDGVNSSDTQIQEDGDDTTLPSHLLQNLSATSHEDIMLLVRDRVIQREAARHACTRVLYGDTLSKLTERILSQTAKGRGFALPQVIGTAPPQTGLVPTAYPLRDIYRAEMEEYAQYTLPRIWNVVSSASTSAYRERTGTSARTLTIDKLMAQYVDEMEKKAPSTVANVLNTSSKLVQPLRLLHCSVCRLAMDRGTSGLRGWGGDQAIESNSTLPESSVQDSQTPLLCYGCTRTLHAS